MVVNLNLGQPEMIRLNYDDASKNMPELCGLSDNHFHSMKYFQSVTN